VEASWQFYLAGDKLALALSTHYFCMSAHVMDVGVNYWSLWNFHRISAKNLYCVAANDEMRGTLICFSRLRVWAML
jgi:hypothetical protein